MLSDSWNACNHKKIAAGEYYLFYESTQLNKRNTSSLLIIIVRKEHLMGMLWNGVMGQMRLNKSRGRIQYCVC